ncbi:MAG: rhomboid family intramembrane serine protease, partial [Actinomycetota bacterium]
YLILFPHAQVTTLVPLFIFIQFMQLPAIVVLALWFVSQFFIGAGQQAGGAGVAWVAHVGGFVAGMILIFLLGGWAKRQREKRTGFG